MEIKFSGPSAIVAILVLAVVFGSLAAFQYSARNRTLESEAVEVLKTWIIADYARAQLPQLEQMAKDPSTDTAELEGMVQNLSRDSVQIVSIKARGKGDDIAVCVEIEVNGGPPPDGRRVRYYGMTHSMVTGWHYDMEISKWSYYLTF